MNARLIIACLFLPNMALAQQAERTTLRAVALSSVKIGTTVRTIGRSGERMEGKLIGLDDAAVSLEVERAPVRVPLIAIDTLWTRYTYAGHGLLIGGLVSALVLSVVICQPSCKESGVIFPGLLITPIPGMLIGAGVGSSMVRWKRRFP